MKLWKKSLLMFIAIVVLTVGAGAVYAMTVLNSALGTAKSTYNDLGLKDTSGNTIKATKPLTFLLMGVDTGDATREDPWMGNSDSMIVVTLNPQTQTTTMMNLQRDTPTNILDASGNPTGSTMKLNAAYPTGYNVNKISGAVQYAMQNIGQQVDLPIDNYALINMDGLINLVNAVGGVDIINDSGGVDVFQGTTSGNITLPVTGESVASGAIYISNTEPSYTAYVPYYSDNRTQTINGDQALVFARDRDTLPNGDYGRGVHQRQVITQLMKKLFNFNNLSQYNTILDAVKGTFLTNIKVDMSTLPSLIGYKDCFNKIVSITYQGLGETTGLGSVQYTSENTYLAFQNAMRKSIGLSTITTPNSNLNTYESEFGTGESYFLPSATVTEKGKSPVTYGVNTDGSLVSITSANQSNFVSPNGGATQAAGGTASSSSADNTDNTGQSSGSTSQVDNTTAGN